MQSFILLLVHALWPNDILEKSHADTVAPREITAITNTQRDSSLITHGHKRRSHQTLREPCPSIKTALKMCAIKFPGKPAQW